jgi:2-phospho-L-lactate guanylyltransferase
LRRWIVVPVKAPGAGKTRLAGVLDDAARRDLVARMLRRVIAAAGAVAGAEVAVLGPSRHGLAATLRLLDDPGPDLNAALGAALPVALDAGCDRLVFVSGDLPLVTTAEIAALADAPADTLAIAPDRVGTGTNALSLPLPQARAFRFGYGPGSFERHRAEAARLGLPIRIDRSAGLAIDIDLPEDLAALRTGAAAADRADRKRDGDA